MQGTYSPAFKWVTQNYLRLWSVQVNFVTILYLAFGTTQKIDFFDWHYTWKEEPEKSQGMFIIPQQLFFFLGFFDKALCI